MADLQNIEVDKIYATGDYWSSGVAASEAFMPYDAVRSVEFVLDKETASTLSRRDRRRIHRMQQSSNAALRLDRARGVLRVTGRGQAVASVAMEIANLSGPRKAVRAAVWAELMRTRLRPDDRSDDAALARLQKQSGCRIHIDRHVMELRLFGPPDTTAAAEKLLEEFEQQVTEQTLPLGSLEGDRKIILRNLQPLADACRVTLRSTDTLVVVLGRHAAVEAAVDKLRSGDIGRTLLAPNTGIGDFKESSPREKALKPSMVADNPREKQLQLQLDGGFVPAQCPPVYQMSCGFQQQRSCTDHFGATECTGTLWPVNSVYGFSNDGIPDGAFASLPHLMMSSQPGSNFSTDFEVQSGSTQVMAAMAPFGTQGMEGVSGVLVPISMFPPAAGATAFFMPVPAPFLQSPTQKTGLY
mmetsp:Transcript_51422/g.111543  ORF Transcript_51422/g.111543 Transcript_51422/m.111543 type:complete len:413 (+) Transcript_51422:79-1317(+)